MANCVRKEWFVKMVLRGDNGEAEGVQQAGADEDGVVEEEEEEEEGLGLNRMKLEGTMASLVVSKEDGATPLAMDALEVEYRVADSSSPGQSQTCKDCFELITPNFPPNTEFLKTEATALTAAGAGILWLAVMSG